MSQLRRLDEVFIHRKAIKDIYKSMLGGGNSCNGDCEALLLFLILVDNREMCIKHQKCVVEPPRWLKNEILCIVRNNYT